MLQAMKEKALQLDAAAREQGDAPAAAASESANGDAAEEESAAAIYDNKYGPKYNAIMAALQVLKPSYLVLIDNSHEHAGHAGNDMDGESHFEVQMVAEAFEDMNLVKRHQLIYLMLGELMPQIHALQIQALTPEEAERRSS
jgi:stress-induced morphogen